LSATCPAFTTCEVAVVPLTVVRSDSGCARIVASIVRSIGFHSASYRICSRRVTRSTDAARRPEPLIVHPSAVRATPICSAPAATPRM